MTTQNAHNKSQLADFDKSLLDNKSPLVKPRKGRRADHPIIKLKRQSLSIYDDLISVKDKIEELIEFPYYDGRFEIERPNIEEDQIKIFDNVAHRASLATKISSLKIIKSQLSLTKRRNKGVLTTSQETAFKTNSTHLASTTSSLDRLCPIGMHPDEYSALSAQKTPGQPSLPLDVQYFMTKNKLTKSIMEINNLLYQENLEPTTLESIIEERGKLSTTAGRRKQSEAVSEVEKIDKEVKRFEDQYFNTLNSKEVSLDSHKSGRKPKSKSAKLTVYKEKMEEKKQELVIAESKLKGADLISRKKHVLEKEKRRAKKDSNIKLMKSYELKITKITALLIEAESVRDTQTEDVINQFSEQGVNGIINNKSYVNLISLFLKKTKTVKTKPTIKSIANKVISQQVVVATDEVNDDMLDQCFLMAEA